MNYVTHTCRNSRLKPDDPNYCDRAFMDKDITHVKDTPPTWKYCPECEKKGFINKKGKVQTDEQLQLFKERTQKSRENKKKQ